LEEETTMDPAKRDVWVARAKAWGTVVAALGGLATAVGAILKPRDDSATKQAYVELAAGQEKLNSAVQGLASDLAGLRGYVAAKEGQPLLPGPPEAPPTLDAGSPTAPTPKPAARAAAAPPKPAPTHVITLGEVSIGGNGAFTPYPSAVAMAAPPSIHAVPPPVHPASFDEVLKAAK
jgi:hypothetical protein